MVSPEFAEFGNGIKEAIVKSYEAVSKLNWDGAHTGKISGKGLYPLKLSAVFFPYLFYLSAGHFPFHAWA